MPIHTSVKSVTATPDAPARVCARPTMKTSGTHAASAPSTASGPPRCAATSSPAKPRKPARRTGWAASSMANASCRQTQPSRISPATKYHSPSTTIATAKPMAGIAAMPRAARSELWLARLAATEPPLALGVLREGPLEGLAREVGPQLVGEDQLRVGRLPGQVVRQPLLAAGADDEIGVVHLRRVEQPREVVLVAPGEAPRGVDDLRAPAV